MLLKGGGTSAVGAGDRDRRGRDRDGDRLGRRVRAAVQVMGSPGKLESFISLRLMLDHYLNFIAHMLG